MQVRQCLQATKQVCRNCAHVKTSHQIRCKITAKDKKKTKEKNCEMPCKRQRTMLALCLVACSNQDQRHTSSAYHCVPLRTTAYHCVCWFYATLGYRLPHARSTPPPEPHVTYVAPVMIPSTADAKKRSLIFIRMWSTYGNSSRDEMNQFLRLLCIHQNLSELSHTLMQHRRGHHAIQFVVHVRNDLAQASASPRCR